MSRLMKGRYSTRKNKENGLYNVFFNQFVPMYCGTFDTKEKAQEFIKGSREYENKLKRAENRKEKEMIKSLHNFEKASIALVEAFARKQDLDFDFFIADNPAGAVSFNCEITFSLDEIYHDLSTNQPKGLITEWFYENLEQYQKGNEQYINYYSWTLGKRYD